VLIFTSKDIKATVHPQVNKPCISCHNGYEKIFFSLMATRIKEKEFVKKVFGKFDRRFFQKNCANCHVSTCLDCHTKEKNTILRPSTLNCLKCHNGYHIGIEYIGLCLRDRSYRYKRGIVFRNKYYLKMQEDVHYKNGLSCSKCHSMKSLISGKKSSRSCLECHKINTDIIEHKISAHIKKLECYSCHSMWVSQEYGTYIIRNYNANVLLSKGTWDKLSIEYARSIYYNKRDLFPLGVNRRGKISPIRPEYIIIYSDIKKSELQNKIISKTWKAVFPHTINRGAPVCNSCHMKRWRFLLACSEEDQDEFFIFDTKKDFAENIMFGCSKKQKILNGSFYRSEKVFDKVKTSEFIKGYLKKWDLILQGVN